MSYINNRTLHDFRFGGLQPSTFALLEPMMSTMTVGEAVAGTGGVLVSGSGNAIISGISIDTRSLQPGDLFFAIRGANNDGHTYLGAALEKGAVGAVIDAQYPVPAAGFGDRVILCVKDTHQALKVLAAAARRRWRGSLVAITGSMGKTTTKEFAAQVLQTEYSVYRSPGNYNNLFGLPLSIIGMNPDDHIGIFEMGMSAPGEIAEMCGIARPDIGIITNVAPVHLEFFKSLEEIALAKGELAESLPPEGLLIYNADDPRVCGIADHYSGNKTAVGFSEGAEIRADRVEIIGLEETRFLITCDGLSYRATMPLAGRHYVMNLLPAIALARHYRIPMSQVVESLRHLHQAGMRGQIIHSRHGYAIIDDSYNSNPLALKIMIDTLARVPGYGRRILVAGEMLELGHEAPSLHRECGAWAARSGVDVVVGIRGNASEIARGAREAGLPPSQAHFFPEAKSAADYILGTLRAGDLVLVKASRGVRLDTLVQTLRAHDQAQMQ